MSRLPAGDVTFVFTDIEGSTRLFHRLGDAYPALQAKHHDVLRREFGSRGGVEVKTEGDAFFFAFSSAVGAVEGAVAAHAALAHESWPEDAAIRVRIGMHTGQATPADDDYVAIPVVLAARIRDAANGGQTLVSSATAALLSGWQGGDVVALGRFWLKDFDEPRRLFAAQRESTTGPVAPRARRADLDLPALPVRMVGRDEELRLLDKMLQADRVVTVVGPGGIGKTALAIAMAHAALPGFRSGAWFVDLSPVTAPEDVVVAVAQRVGAAPLTIDGIVTVLGHGRCLLVLDSCEHVAAAVTAVVDEIGAQCPEVVVVATSRAPLRARGEQLLRLGGLGEGATDPSDDPAVALFLQRAQATQGALAPAARDRAVIAEVCRALDRMPLAIELAAARVGVLGVDGLRARLDQRLELLGRRNATGRQDTLRSLIDWSYDLLAGDERAGLRRLSVLPGPATLEMAIAVMNAADEVAGIDILESLVERSLVMQVVDDGSSAPPRFRLLETVRQYAAQQLEALNETANAQAGLVDAVIRMATAAGDQVSTALLADRESVRAAFMHAAANDVGRAVAVAAAIGSAFDSWGDLDLADSVLRALDAVDDHDSVWCAAAAAAAFLLIRAENRTQARRIAEAVLDSTDTAKTRGIAHQALAIVSVQEGDFDGARRHNSQAIQRYHEGGDVQNEMTVRYNLGPIIDWEAGDIEGARATFEAGLEATADVQFRVARSLILLNLGQLHLAEGDVAGARSYAEGAVELLRARGHRPGLINALRVLARAEARDGRPDLAREALNEIEALDVRGFATSGVTEAEVALAEGNVEEAAEILEAMDRSAFRAAATDVDELVRRVEAARAQRPSDASITDSSSSP